MYGIVNQSLKDLITENYGAENWRKILVNSGVGVEYFLSNETYDDKITYDIANAAALVLGKQTGDILFELGNWWILKTSKQRYGSLLQSGGVNLLDFLVNLPVFHNRIMLMYPKIMPPQFKITDITSHTVHVHYYSNRLGLQDFVKGLLTGLGELYQTPVTVELVRSREIGNDHEIFKVCW